MNDCILTLITFTPAVGAVLLMLMPRNDRLLRWAALMISLLTFGLSLYLPLNISHGTFDFNRDWITTGISTSTITWPPTASPCGWCC